jgi:hypothetical protein
VLSHILSEKDAIDPGQVGCCGIRSGYVNHVRRTIMIYLPQSQKNVLEILCAEGGMTHKDLVNKSSFSPRAIRYALRKLKEKNLLIEKINMHDMRQIIYQYRLIPEENCGLAECSTTHFGYLWENRDQRTTGIQPAPAR